MIILAVLHHFAFLCVYSDHFLKLHVTVSIISLVCDLLSCHFMPVLGMLNEIGFVSEQDYIHYTVKWLHVMYVSYITNHRQSDRPSTVCLEAISMYNTVLWQWLCMYDGQASTLNGSMLSGGCGLKSHTIAFTVTDLLTQFVELLSIAWPVFSVHLFSW